MKMDASLIESLIDEYGTELFRFCRKLTYSEHDAEELYQDTFLKAMDLNDRIDVNNNPKSYLLSIAVSLWNNKKRKYARRNRIAPTESFDMEESHQIASDDSTPEEALLKKELYATVNKCIDALDEKMRVPILLFYNSQLSVEKIAQIIDVPVGTVKSRLHKARALIKEQMEVYGIDGF